MGAFIRFLVISAAVIIPWIILRVTDLEARAREWVEYIRLSDTAIIALLVLPPIIVFLIKWLFDPRGNRQKRYSAGKNVLIKFRG